MNRCHNCGYGIEGKALFCPNCGIKLNVEAQPAKARSQTAGQPAAFDLDAGERREGCGLSLAVVGIAIVAMLAILGLAFAAYYYGMRDRAQAVHSAAYEHYNKGAAHLQQGEYELAVAELEVALQLNPNDAPAQAALAEAKRQLEERPSPTPVLEVETKAAYMEELRAAYAAQDWQRVYDYADRLLALDPQYQRGEVDAILFEAFYRSGLQLVQEDRVKEALRLFDRALALQPNHAQVTRAKELATLYVTAMGYWGADWAKTVESLQTLYRLDPAYDGVRQQLKEALVQQGDLLWQQNQGCPASEAFAQALQFGGDDAVQTKYTQALAACNGQPLPTDGATPGATVAPQGPSGSYVGRVVRQEGIGGTKIFVRGKVLDKNGKGVQGTQVKIQAWDWSALALTDGNGQFAFDGLGNEVDYTLSLVSLPGQPVKAPGVFGKITWVYFEQAR